MFFAEHYANGWFETWNYKWYTGFTITSYPPLVHQIIALFSKIVGLKFGFYIWSLCAIFLFIRGVYKFSLIWVHERAASYAAILSVFSSSLVEAVHIFGQLPSITGIAFLLNACPEIYKWFRYQRKIHLFLGLALLTVTTTAHHVSTIFGMIFFILPVIGTAVIDNYISEKNGIQNINLKGFIKRAVKAIPRSAGFGLLVIAITIIVIFPYWYWSKTDPISQIPIPHGSRENFLFEGNLGTIFFLIPWGMMLFFLPYLAKRLFVRRNIFLAISVFLAFLLGTGGTTPIPKMLLGETAFNILTLDRFTFWASILSLPFWGAFFNQIIHLDLKEHLLKLGGKKIQITFLSCFVIGIILSNVLIVNLGHFKPFQPEKIDIKPITNFLQRDQHDKWRYLTLGFGDQMAWLSANTTALTVDGNYHSARRLPELTTRAIERLENAKYQKMEGIGALDDFLTMPEKYNLKYVFSNDKFYEPVLHFNGWSKVQLLENNIVIWEYPDVPPLQYLLPSKNIPIIQRLMWGILPLTCFSIAFLLYVLSRTKYIEDDILLFKRENYYESNNSWNTLFSWILFLFVATLFIFLNFKLNKNNHSNPKNLAVAYFDAIDFKRFQDAYTLLDPNSRSSFDQFMLELSVEDGILASFAKLDHLKFDIISNEHEAVVQVIANWVTSLNEYQSHHKFDMIKSKRKWYIVKEEFEKNIPPNQFFSLPKLDFKNQGRRKTKIEKTPKEDILDRPEAQIIQANLIKSKDGYHVVGSVQNIDNVPSFVSMEAIMYDKNGNQIDRAKAGEKIIHDLLPKETTPFRIDFKNGPYYYKPHEVVLFAKTLVSDKELYKFQGIANLKSQEDKLTGHIINYGTNEINIPQILYAQYDENQTLFWVGKEYLEKGIRPQRKKSFSLSLADKQIAEKINKIDKVFINGVPNLEMKISGMALPSSEFHHFKKTKFGMVEARINSFVYELNK